MADNGQNCFDDSNIPSVLDLGLFRSDIENTFVFELMVDEQCNISSTAESIIKLSPTLLSIGKNEITICISKLRNEIILYAKILLSGRITREIVITGQASETADVKNNNMVIGSNNCEKIDQNGFSELFLPPDIKDNKLVVLKKGQRVLINSSYPEIKIQLEYVKKIKPIEIDGYVFLTDETEKVSKDRNLIFWGNKRSDNGSVTLIENGSDSFFSIYLNRISDDIKKIVVCYSIYGDDNKETFGYIDDPYIRIFSDGVESERFYMSELSYEKTIVAVEIYLHKGMWKLNCIGAGYKKSLEELCKSYGLEISD